MDVNRRATPSSERLIAAARVKLQIHGICAETDIWKLNQRTILSFTTFPQLKDLYLSLKKTVSLPPTTAPEQCAGPPSPLCACSRSTPTEAAGGHWVFCWAEPFRSGRGSPPLKAPRCLSAHIGTRGSDRRPCREPVGSSRTWMGSEVSMLVGGRGEKDIP